MNNLNFTRKSTKHFTNFDRGCLEGKIKNREIVKIAYDVADESRSVKSTKFLINISALARELDKDRKSIRREILRGLIDKPKAKNDDPDIKIYSASASEHLRITKIKSLKKRKLKIHNCPKLIDYIKDKLDHRHSLKVIAGRLKARGVETECVETLISGKTLYNYIDNERIEFITRRSLKLQRKRHQRDRPHGKRINGIPIDKRSQDINDRTTLFNYEGDTIIGKRGTNCHLFTMIERWTRRGIAVKIEGNTPDSIINAIRNLQKDKILIYGENIKTLTLDNGPEFHRWIEMSKNINTGLCNIEIFFCHPYSSFEKGSVEHFNWMIRQWYPKGTDFSKITQDEINRVVDEINNYPREIWGYKTANEMYNEPVQN